MRPKKGDTRKRERYEARPILTKIQKRKSLLQKIYSREGKVMSAGELPLDKAARFRESSSLNQTSVGTITQRKW